MARTAKKFLNVKYTDRELAKRLGAKWDPSVQRWYCPAGSPLATIFKWRAEAAEPKPAVKDDVFDHGGAEREIEGDRDRADRKLTVRRIRPNAHEAGPHLEPQEQTIMRLGFSGNRRWQAQQRQQNGENAHGIPVSLKASAYATLFELRSRVFWGKSDGD